MIKVYEQKRFISAYPAPWVVESSVLDDRAVWDRLGTPSDHYAWMSTQCRGIGGHAFCYCVIKTWNNYNLDPAHVSNALDGGTGHKTPWSIVPLSADLHRQWQHQKGWVDMLDHHLPDGAPWNYQSAMAWARSESRWYVKHWSAERLREQIADMYTLTQTEAQGLWFGDRGKAITLINQWLAANKINVRMMPAK